MTDRTSLEVSISGARIGPAVTTLRPDYRALLIAVDGIIPVQGDGATEALPARAETAASDPLAEQPRRRGSPCRRVARGLPRFRRAKPQRTRNSLESLLRRAGTGLPRVNGPADIYNAISVIHQVPLGGEDPDRYAGPIPLIRATGCGATTRA